MEYEVKLKINVSCEDEILVKESFKKVINNFLDNQSFITGKNEILSDIEITLVNKVKITNTKSSYC